ncbi:uncharacterized protein LOC132178021 [Corylus avellana]|uniref:uncharacterized protein LOC132178021 n=1 Tax=Corylus avellana TaxID=13451 RepID=UPI00286B0A30|nr:uncharacterized protein LOC132178021 [Corylus avellana]
MDSRVLVDVNVDSYFPKEVEVVAADGERVWVPRRSEPVQQELPKQIGSVTNKVTEVKIVTTPGVGVDRKLLWINLASMKVRVANNPWMICGDFNVVKSLAEKWGSDKLNLYDVEFGQCLNDLEVLDLNSSGCFYTWTNKSEEPRFVAGKLDKVLVNEFWMSYFVKTIVEFLSGGISDHSPAIISVGSLQSFGPKPFKFFNYWLDHKDFMSWVKEKRVMEAQDNLDPAYKEVIASFGRAYCLLKERECLSQKLRNLS